MISISKPQKAAQAKDYLSKESYYQQNGKLGQWHGSKEALSYLNLVESSSIEKSTYASILNGIHPKNGKHLLTNSGSEKRRAGIDVTFSAPKSVSLLMSLSEGVGEKQFEAQIRDAHERAAQYAMDQISAHYAKTRIRQGKDKRVLVNTEAIWASFQHDTTRETDRGEIDPQLHTHNFMMALTFYKDPTTGKLKPYAMSNEEIYANKMYLGQLYRNALAHNLDVLGLEIKVTDVAQGFFELEGFGSEQLDLFSGRHTELLEKLANSDLKFDNRAKLLDLINAKTKKSKRKIDKESLINRNQKRMKTVGLDRSFLGQFSIHKERVTKDDNNKSKQTLEHLHKTLDLLEEHHSVFGYEEIMKSALKLGLEHGYVLKDYDEAFDSIMKEGRLIKLDQNVYSTKAIVEAEREVIRLMIQGKGYLPGYTRKKNAEGFIDQLYENMTQGQRDMVAGVLGTEDQFIVIQGDAGTGKTYAASAIHDFMLLQHPSTEVLGLSFTGKAAQSLEEESGIASSTLHRFIYQEENRQTDIPKRRLILVDEAGMAGSLQIAKLMKIAKENGDKVVFIGDTKQFSSISAGNIFQDMQTYGAQTIYMSETMRQKSAHAKGIVKAVKSKNMDKAIRILEKRGAFNEIDRDESIDQIAQTFSKNYANSDPLKDELIIASRNADRIRINESIRDYLEKAGKGETHTIRQVCTQSGVGKFFTDTLEEGMLLIPSKVPGTKNGAEYRIRSIIDEKNIEIEASGGKHLVIDFYRYSKQCQIFEEIKKEFSLGETIIFTKNTTTGNTKVKNGERAVIERIENGVIQTTSGKTVDLKEMNFIDYGYAITDFKSQGATTKNVTILADAQMASVNAFYTQVTRAKENITIYTDNKDALFANLKKDLKRRSTLEYTMNGKEIENIINRRRSITNNFKQAGIYLSSIVGRISKAEQLLALPQSTDIGQVKIADNLIDKLEKAVQKFDQLFTHIEKTSKKKSKNFKKDSKNISPILHAGEKTKKETRRSVVTIKL